ncbi:hypothetical protein [Erwinia amylovora]|uniref:hypothetical protein n=1 Tax=Erwinia amylovora TaxID=552 RepID=UPI003D035E97
MTQYAWFKAGDGREVYRKVPEGGPDNRSDLPAPMLSIDTMEPVQSMLDGKMYDSKSALRRTYKVAGMVEVGNDPSRLTPFQKPKTDRKAIRRAIDKAAAEYSQGRRAR